MWVSPCKGLSQLTLQHHLFDFIRQHNVFHAPHHRFKRSAHITAIHGHLHVFANINLSVLNEWAFTFPPEQPPFTETRRHTCQFDLSLLHIDVFSSASSYFSPVVSCAHSVKLVRTLSLLYIISFLLFLPALFLYLPLPPLAPLIRHTSPLSARSFKMWPWHSTGH